MIPSVLAALCLAPAAELSVKPTDWPQFRGPNRDGVSPETGLLKEWPKAGPTKVWTATGLGTGFAAPSVAAGRIYGLGYKEGKEILWARKEADGSPLWATPFADVVRVGNQNTGSASTPTYHDGRVYALGLGGELVCADAASGKIVWRKSYTKDFGGRVPGWGYCESVLVDDGKVIAAPNGRGAAVVALNADTGSVVWRADLDNPGMGGGYSSAVKAEVGGVPIYVTLLGRSEQAGVVGVHAKTGKVLWHYNRMMNSVANIPTPVVKGDRLFVSTGYQAGAALLKLVPAGDGVQVEEVKFYKGGDLQNHHGGMVAVGDCVYLGSQHNKGFPACVDLNTGDIKWVLEKPADGGDGSAAVSAADGMLYFRYQNGVMALIKADPAEFHLVSSFKIPDPSGKASWPYPVIANGKLYLRDQEKLHCFNLKAASN